MSQPSFDFDDPDVDVDDGGEPTYTVGELADAINGTLRRGFGDGVWVRGEIQGWNERGPHAYFRWSRRASRARPSSTSSSSHRPGCACGRCSRRTGCGSPTA